MTLFKNKYRVESIRLKHWDYSSDGAYFITICTKDRKELFGEIRNGIMGLNEMGMPPQFVGKTYHHIFRSQNWMHGL